MRLSQGVIMDVDGTLVDSNRARAQAWVEALRAHGHDTPYGTLLDMVGLVPNEILTRCTGLGMDTALGRSIHAHYLDVFGYRLLPRLQPCYRGRELFERVRELGLRLAVASTDPPDILLEVLRVAGAESMFHQASSPAPADEPMSNRDVIKAALDRLGASPPHVLMIADAPFDVDAGAHLNVPVIALQSGGWSSERLTGAVGVYEDARDLLDRLETSAIARLVLGAQPTIA